MSAPRTQDERRRLMRARLVAAARELLATVPYDDLTMDAVMERAGVSRGGLYHHFADRRALFQAVNEQLNEEFFTRVASSLDRTASAEENLERAMVEFLHACTDPVVIKVVVLEAPAVLGYEEWIEDAHARWTDTVKAMLEVSAREGADPPGDLDTLAHLLIATVDMAGLLVARQPDTLPQVEATMISLMKKILKPA